MVTPQWYIDLIEIASFISNKDWGSVHGQAVELNKELYAKAPSVKKEFENVVLLTMSPQLSEEQEKAVTVAYNKSVAAADKEISTEDFDRVMKEEEISDRLDVLSEKIGSSMRIIWNYWRGEKCGDYIEWESIQEEIESVPLTRIGRLRLLARHATVGKRLLPSFMKMAVQLWPLAAIWVIKKVGTLLITSTVNKSLEARKTKKQLQGLSKRMQGQDFNIGSLKKQPRKKK